MGDTGLTGRKIIVDTYGGMGRHGGGAFSGKDPTKVDRSAAYMARYIAKNIVAAGLADAAKCSWLTRSAWPIRSACWWIPSARARSIRRSSRRSGARELPADAEGHHRVAEPAASDLSKTAAYGHFGRNDPDFTWEATDKAAKLASDAGLAGTGACKAREAISILRRTGMTACGVFW